MAIKGQTEIILFIQSHSHSNFWTKFQSVSHALMLKELLDCATTHASVREKASNYIVREKDVYEQRKSLIQSKISPFYCVPESLPCWAVNFITTQIIF